MASFISEKEVLSKIENAFDAYSEWRRLSVKKRWSCLLSLRDEIYKRRDDLGVVLRKEARQTNLFTSSSIYASLLLFSPKVYRLASNLLHCKEYIYRGLYNEAYKSFEPIGTIGVFLPYNAPLYLAILHIIQVTILGNTLVLKFSERTPSVAKIVEEVVAGSLIPHGVVTVIGGDRDIGKIAADSPYIRKIVVYGDTHTGEEVLRLTSKSIKPVVCELSGNEPAIVMDDCDIKYTVSRLIYAAFNNAGQVCTAVKRVFVDRQIFHEFQEECANQLSLLNLHFESSLKNNEAYIYFVEIIRGVPKKNILWGRVEKYEPVVLTELPLEHKLMQETVMFPYMCINSFLNDDEVIRYANFSPFGLSASVWSKNVKKARRIAERIEAAKVSINETQIFHMMIPHGGMKKSGFGKVGGVEGLKEYVYLKVFTVAKKRKIKGSSYWLSERMAIFMEAFTDLMFCKSILQKLRRLKDIIILFLRMGR